MIYNPTQKDRLQYWTERAIAHIRCNELHRATMTLATAIEIGQEEIVREAKLKNDLNDIKARFYVGVDDLREQLEERFQEALDKAQESFIHDVDEVIGGRS